MKARVQPDIFRAREGGVLWNQGASIIMLSKTPEKEAPQGNILEFFLLDALKTTF